MPEYVLYGEFGYARARTFGSRPGKRLLHDEKISKKRLSNPMLWRQLEAISNGTKVNHLGRGHSRGLEYG